MSAASAAPVSDAPRHAITSALSSYDNWRETYVGKAHADKSDAAMKNARAQIVANVDQMLGLPMLENMATDEAAGAVETPGAADCLKSIGAVHLEQGDFPLAREHIQRALATYEAAGAGETPGAAECRSFLTG